MEETLRHILTIGCLTALGAIAAIVAACALARVFAPALAWTRSHGAQALFLAPFVLCLVYRGATKGTVTFPYTDVETRYLVDAGSYTTNDHVHVAFTRSAIVPDAADFLGYYRPNGSTNDADWVEFLVSSFAAFHSPSNIPFANAWSNDFQFFTTYTPGPVVHTNGVAIVNWQKPTVGTTNTLVPIRTGFYVNALRVAPNPSVTNAPIVLSVTLTPNGETDD